MCSHYQGIKERERYLRHFGVEPPSDLGKADLWPGYLGTFIRRHPHADVGDEAVPPREALTGLFGLVPHWSQDTKITKHTFNARSETVAEKPSFRDAWQRNQHCIIPVSYTHLRAHETRHDLVCRLLLEKKKKRREKRQNSGLV